MFVRIVFSCWVKFISYIKGHENKFIPTFAAPEESDEVEIDYRTDSELRISWQPFEDERLQHYEVRIQKNAKIFNAVCNFSCQIF